jgi:hypothetical protein
MGNKRVLALRKQLKREQLNVQWLEQHLPHSLQLNSVCQLCVVYIYLALSGADGLVASKLS